MLSDQIKQDMFLAFQTGGCLLLHESSFLCYLHSAMSNHLSIAISIHLNGRSLKTGLTVYCRCDLDNDILDRQQPIRLINALIRLPICCSHWPAHHANTMRRF